MSRKVPGCQFTVHSHPWQVSALGMRVTYSNREPQATNCEPNLTILSFLNFRLGRAVHLVLNGKIRLFPNHLYRPMLLKIAQTHDCRIFNLNLFINSCLTILRKPDKRSRAANDANFGK